MRLTSDAIPGFRDAFAIVRGAASSIRPPGRITTSAWAERDRWVKDAFGVVKPWRNSLTPFLVEPMDAALLRSVAVVALLGATQWGKTEILLNLIGHAGTERPGDLLALMPTEALAKDFGTRRVDERLIRTSRAVREKLGRARNENTTLTKIFSNGTRVDIVWPTEGNLASRPVATGLIDELDRLPESIGDEGDPVSLMRNRVKAAGAAGVVVVASSIGRRNGSGILALYERSDRRLWFVPCPHCAEFFSPLFDEERKPTLAHFHIPEHADRDQAAAGAALGCPHCGGLIEERQRTGMNAAGVWLGAGQAIDAAGAISGEAARSEIRGYWFPGVMSPFQKWSALARDYLDAKADYERTGDDGKLFAVVTSQFGLPYVDPHAGAPVDTHMLELRRERHALGTVPAGACYLVAAVDVQKGRFAVAVYAFGADFEAWLIDRFEIRQLGDGRTDVNPALYPEHWDVLTGQVFDRKYPLAGDHPWFREGQGGALRAATVVIDTGGEAGVTENAKRFWAKVRRKLSDWRITLVKGHHLPDAPIMPMPTYERDERGNEKLFGPKVYVIGVSRLKDIVHDRLNRSEPGPGYIHLPHDLDRGHLAELGREKKEGGVWVRASDGPNETWDLTVYSAFGARRLKPHKVQDWLNPPSYFAPIYAGEGALGGVALAVIDDQVAAPAAPPASIDDAVIVSAGPRASAAPASSARVRGKGWTV